MNKPTRFQAAVVAAALSLLFIVVYGPCNWITAHRSDVGTWYYSWERFIPFVPLMIVPYMSIDLFFVAAPFLCRSREELGTLAKRISLAIVIAGICFLTIPLRFAVPRPQTTDWTGSIFAFLHSFDQPYNLFPSLHITFRTILASFYARRTKGVALWASHIWFSLIGFSTLLTYQHHVVDIAGGFVLAAICFYVIPDSRAQLPVIPNRRVGAYYAVGCAALTASAFIRWPWTGILLWPAVSVGIVALGYFGLGPGIYRKTNGRLPFSARVVLGPCLLGQYLSLLHYRRRCSSWNAVTPNLWIGTKLSNREAVELKRLGVTAVLDLTAEFSEAPVLRGLVYRNIPVLDLTRLSLKQLIDAAGFIKDESGKGIVYVHCKVGYSRTAGAVGAYLLSAGLATNARQVVEVLRNARPGIIIRPEALAALNDFAAGAGPVARTSKSAVSQVS